MPANSSTPYRRIGTNSWQELLDQVNEELEDPEPGCDPIDPIEPPEPQHIWAKSDIQEVQDKLDEMPEDCFEWEDIPDLWKVSIIEEIEEQLTETWCDCEECCEPCPNAGSDIKNIVLSTTNSSDCCTPGTSCQLCSSDRCQFNECLGMEDGEVEFLEWADLKKDLCILEDEIEDLEDEIETLEETIDQLNEDLSKCGPGEEGNACREAIQALIDEKEQELDEKEQELEEKEAERDQKETEAGEKDTEYHDLNQAFSGCLQGCCGGNLCADCMLGFKPSGNAWDINCENQTPDCCGNFFSQCAPLWSLQERTSSNWDPGNVSPWRGEYFGWIDPDGTALVITFFNDWCSCIRAFGCSCLKGTSGACSSCGGGGLTCRDWGGSGFGITEWRTSVSLPFDFEPHTCDDEPCEEEEAPL